MLICAWCGKDQPLFSGFIGTWLMLIFPALVPAISAQGLLDRDCEGQGSNKLRDVT